MFEQAQQTWCCPFCQKKTISVHYIPRHREVKTIRGSGQSASKNVYKNPDLTILSETCSNCGKTKKEIEPLL